MIRHYPLVSRRIDPARPRPLLSPETTPPRSIDCSGLPLAQTKNRPAAPALLALKVILALTAMVSGIGLLSRLNVPPLAVLDQSRFTSFLLPRLALLILVGGTALVAALLLIRGHRHAGLAAVVATVMIILSEKVEVTVIGSPVGVARNLQIVYFAIGLAGLVIPVAFNRSPRPPGRG